MGYIYLTDWLSSEHSDKAATVFQVTESSVMLILTAYFDFVGRSSTAIECVGFLCLVTAFLGC